MSKPKIAKPPAPTAPAAVPETIQPEAEESEMKRLRRQMGYQSTILTGALAPRNKGGRTMLG